jgi:hypothetical protein
MSGGLDPSSHQTRFASALLDPSLDCPVGLRTWNGSDPLRRLAVHRNNVVVSLIDALADTFEVTQQLVGTEFFRAMAAVFVRQHPPRSRILAHYGDDFAAFIAGFAPAADLPCLADMARLEFARVQACHAAEAEPIAGAALTHALSRPDELAGMRLEWHPSVRLIESPYAVVSLWAAHQTEAELPSVEIDRAEHAIVLRDALDVLVLPAEVGTACFLARTLEGVTFGPAASEATAADPAFDLGATLSLLMSHGALTALCAPHPSTSSSRSRS